MLAKLLFVFHCVTTTSYEVDQSSGLYFILAIITTSIGLAHRELGSLMVNLFLINSLNNIHTRFLHLLRSSIYIALCLSIFF